MNKRASVGFNVRIIASFIITISLPFIIVNPTNTIAQIVFAFGAFLLVVGGSI